MQNCNATQTPEIDHEALRAKYLAERDKRLRPEGQKQYLVTEDEFDGVLRGRSVHSGRAPATDHRRHRRGDPRWRFRRPHRRRPPQAGRRSTNFRVIELGGDFGGVWYWNRYPGIQVDSESYCYLPLFEETGYMPKEKYSNGRGVLRTRPAHRQALRPLRQRDLQHPGQLDLEWDEEITALADRHQPRRRHPRPVRGDVPGAVQQAETARHPGHQGLQRAHLPHGALGLRVHRRRHDTAGWTGWPVSGSPSSAPAPAASR